MSRFSGAAGHGTVHASMAGIHNVNVVGVVVIGGHERDRSPYLHSAA